jgi:hypothetical protein
MSGAIGNPAGRGGGACGARFAHMLRCVETRGSAAACAAEVDAFLACERAVFQAASRRGGKDGAWAPQQAAADSERDGTAPPTHRRAWPMPPQRPLPRPPILGRSRAGGERWGEEAGSAGADGDADSEGGALSGPGGPVGPPLHERVQRELETLRGMVSRAAGTQGRACRELWGMCANEQLPGKVWERCTRIAVDAGKSASAIAAFCARGAQSVGDSLKCRFEEWRDSDKK